MYVLAVRLACLSTHFLFWTLGSYQRSISLKARTDGYDGDPLVETSPDGYDAATTRRWTLSCLEDKNLNHNDWLVVYLPPLKNMKVNWDDDIKVMFQSTNQMMVGEEYC